MKNLKELKDSVKNFFCFDYSVEWVFYFIIEIALIAFLIISIYNTNKLVKFHEEDNSLKEGLNIAIECTVILVGIYLGFIWWKVYIKKNKLSTLQACFCGHISPFLIITGITTMIATSKRISHF